MQRSIKIILELVHENEESIEEDKEAAKCDSSDESNIAKPHSTWKLETLE